MAQIEIFIVWCILQVSLLCLVGGSLYLLARVFEPRLGRTSVAVLLALVTILSLAALSPWPSWQFRSLAGSVVTRVPMGQVDGESPSTAARERSETPDFSQEAAGDPPPTTAIAPASWSTFWGEMSRPVMREGAPSAARPERSRHWSWLAVAIVGIASAVGGIRLLLAWLCLRRLRTHSVRISDPRMDRLAAGLRSRLGLAVTVEFRQSREIASAATIGWRRPVILLPSAWRQWPEEELRAVLAHELAHVAAGDWLAFLMAQVAVTLHFYHPLVHWLAYRLRLEQELAADAAAVAVTGSKETYLGNLAAQMLRTDRARPVWAAQTFLPTRSTIVRRIEMLKSKSSSLLARRSPASTRVLVIGAVLITGNIAAGFRPANTTIGSAEGASATSEAQSGDGAVEQDLKAAQRAQSMNNLRQLALAMHNYRQVHGHFPPPVLTGPDGETKHSWRVAILPFLEQPTLYDDYRLTEPWDSERNKRLLESMPAVFRSPTEPAGTTTSAYYVLVGEETMFEPTGEGVGIGEIRDGTSKTIMLVEVKRDIPWTKPEDLPYSPEEELPELGGHLPGVFLTALADGSVRAVSTEADAEALRPYITKTHSDRTQPLSSPG